MPFLKHWPEDAPLADVFRADLDLYYPFAQFTEALMRGPSSLSIQQRELIMAFVSGLNGCRFCVHAHWAAARIPATKGLQLQQLLDDLDSSPVREPLKPLLRLARKITLDPAGITQADVDAVFAAGWDEKAYRDTVAIAARANLINRVVSGFGIQEHAQNSRGRPAGAPRRGYLERMDTLRKEAQDK